MASPPHPDPAWQRLADLLIKRRVDIDVRYRNRRTFCAETDIEYRVISDIEGSRRTNFSRPMISQIENAYRLTPGNIQRILQGGDLEPLEPVLRVSQAEMEAPAASEPKSNPDADYEPSLRDLVGEPRDDFEREVFAKGAVSVDYRLKLILMYRHAVEQQKRAEEHGAMDEDEDLTPLRNQSRGA
jgi:hypothetical protein